MSSRARVALLALLVLATAGPAAAAVPVATVGGDGATAPATAEPPAQTAQQSVEPTATTFVVALEPDGDARWTVVMNYSVATEERRAAFRSLAAEFEDGRELRTLTAVRQASAEASTATGREMRITDERRDSRIRNDTGQLVVGFTWTNFARQTNDTLRVDDVFDTEQGWFQGLGANQALVIEPPDGYRLDSAEPAGYQVSQGSLRWEGERQFEPGELAIEYQDVGTWPLTAGQSALAVAMVISVLGAVAYVLRGGTLDVPLPTGADESGDGAPSPAGDGPAGGVGADTETADDTDGADEDDVDEELLSDEERIERLLADNGGRMKQANIVSETGWSNAKVSQLLSSMDEEGRIDKLRIGRENLISFPDEDITDNGDEE